MATSNYSKAYADYMNERNEVNRKATLDSLLNGINTAVSNAKAGITESDANYDKLLAENVEQARKERDDANVRYQDLINQVQVDKYKSGKRMRERYANLYGSGDNGMSRTNALYNNVKYDNQTNNLKRDLRSLLDDIDYREKTSANEYNTAKRNYQNTVNNNITSLWSDYYNNVARVNAQYDANILPWYDEDDGLYMNNTYYGGGRSGNGNATIQTTPIPGSKLGSGLASGVKVGTSQKAKSLADAVSNIRHYSLANSSPVGGKQTKAKSLLDDYYRAY